jgi:hypothetical protein
MKIAYYVILVMFVVAYLGTLLQWNDVRYQRDVWITTADWCYKAPESNRCRFWVEAGSEVIPRNYFYRNEK